VRFEFQKQANIGLFTGLSNKKHLTLHIEFFACPSNIFYEFINI